MGLKAKCEECDRNFELLKLEDVKVKSSHPLVDTGLPLYGIGHARLREGNGTAWKRCPGCGSVVRIEIRKCHQCGGMQIGLVEDSSADAE